MPLTRKQCAKCPWKVSTDPYEIPNGYCVSRHVGLQKTIADPGSLHGLGGAIRMMACHECTIGAELPCVGWLANQLGPGNNIALRIRCMWDSELADFETVGEQHPRFEDTLP